MTDLTGVIAAAVVGTGRRTVDWSRVPAELRGPMGTSGPEPGQQEAAVLRAAGRAAVAERATGGLTAVGDLTAPPPPERLSAPGTRFLQLFGEAAGSRRLELVADGLRLLADSGLRLPIGVVVPVLELAATRRELRPLLAPVLGERGSWLARQNPAWRFPELLRPEIGDERAWHEGTVAERIAWLRAVRAADPERARALLVEALPGESASTRLPLLQLLADGLTTADEPLLEAALDDRSRPVRELAQALLPRLPDSAYLQRMRSRVRQRLTWRTTSWRVDLDELGPDDERDGLVAIPGERPPGERAMAILVGAIPVADWPELAGLAASGLVGAPLTGGPGFETGLAVAAVREGDPVLALDLLRQQQVLDPELFAVTRPADGDQLLAGRIGRTEARQWLPALGARRWSPGLTERVLDWLESPGTAAARPGVLALCGPLGSVQHRADAAGRLRRMARGFPGPQQNQAFGAAMTLELRRGLSEALEPPTRG